MKCSAKAKCSSLKLSASAIMVTYALYFPSNSWALEQNINTTDDLNSSFAQINLATTHGLAQNSPPLDHALIATTKQSMSFASFAYDKTQQNSQDNLASSSTLVNSPKNTPKSAKQAKKLNTVSNFATNIYQIMVNNPTSARYLQNRHLSASSTFPLRLLTKLQGKRWQASPFMPVQDKDASCYYDVPSYKEPLSYDVDNTPVEVSADDVQGSIDKTITYKGNVVITQADKTLKSDEATYNNETGEVLSKGNITYQSGEVTITSNKFFESNTKTKISKFHAVKFQLNGSVASGEAKLISLDDNKRTAELEDLRFSTCPAGNNSWHFETQKVELAQDDAYGEAYNSVLYIKDVPVMYVPYANFPITNERKSGLLYPSFSISSINGIDYEQPIYINLAPNYDYTITPRLMTKRGILIGNEFRYMPFSNTYGIINFDIIPEDRNWQQSKGNSNHRYLFKLQQQVDFIKKDLVFDIDYQKVRNNDYDYLNDIGFTGADITDDHLKQSFLATYNSYPYNVSLEIRDYQRLLPEENVSARPFAFMPQLKANYFNTYKAFTFDINGEVTQFSSTSDIDANRFEATRIHFEPGVSYQLLDNRGTSVTASARGFLTHYRQDDLGKMPSYYHDELGFTNLASNKTRALYLLQLHGKTTLERKVLDLRHTQTLEPEIQYQYIPYRDQSDIALFDTTDRMSDYYTNYSFRHYTGNDRIADINNLTVGLTSRLLDAHDRELMRLGVSQTYSFVPTRVTLNPNDPQNLYPRSPLSFFFNVSPIPEITSHASVTYNNDTNSVSSWNAMTEYKNENGLIFQVSYRFADKGNRSFSNNIIDLSQLGVVTQVPLNNYWTTTAAFYHDLKQDDTIDAKFSLKYDECCWGIAFVYESYNKTAWDDLSQQRDHFFGVRFEFKGLGTVNVTGNTHNSDLDTYLLKSFNPTNLSR